MVDVIALEEQLQDTKVFFFGKGGGDGVLSVDEPSG